MKQYSTDGAAPSLSELLADGYRLLQADLPEGIPVVIAPDAKTVYVKWTEPPLAELQAAGYRIIETNMPAEVPWAIVDSRKLVLVQRKDGAPGAALQYNRGILKGVHEDADTSRAAEQAYSMAA